jgi:integrase
VFDSLLRDLRDNDAIQLHAGNVSLQTAEEVEGGFIDENGYRMGNVTRGALNPSARKSTPSSAAVVNQIPVTPHSLTTAAGVGQTAAIIEQIAKNAPTLADLNPEQLKEIARIVMTQRLTDELNSAVNIAGIDWKTELNKFLGDCKSVHTAKAYGAALDRLETWAAREKVNPLSMDYTQGDDFIRALRAEGRAAASVRRDIDAVSAFFSWLERYHKTIKNPIRGTRLRPEREAKKSLIIPTTAELKILLAEANPIEKAVISVMAYRGLRAGALPTLEKHGERWTGNSKGKPIKENQIDGVTLPGVALEAMSAAGLNDRKPFGWLTTNAIEKRVRYLTEKLYDCKKISAAFSCHDFRHYFAVTEYTKNRDIFRLSKLLNHGGVQVTQNYLRSLGIEADA